MRLFLLADASGVTLASRRPLSGSPGSEPSARSNARTRPVRVVWPPASRKWAKPLVTCEDLHDLVAERYEQGATIVTSNLDFSEWGDAFPNRLLGAATLDRLRHGAYRLTLEGESYRSPRPIPERRISTLATGEKSKK